MRKDERPTLNDIRKSPKFQKVVRLSDLVTNEEKTKLRALNAKTSKKKKRPYDDIDAFVAEVIARFGYDVYQKWNNGEIETKTLQKWVLAERARDRAQFIPLEGVIAHMVGACIRRNEKERAPKGPKEAQKIISLEIKTARGEG